MIRVLIVGGGPAGMTAAIALARRGIGSEIVERETEWRPAGIGIGLQSPPMRAMRELDLLSPLQERSWHHHVMDMMRPDGMKVAEMPQVNVLGPDDPPFVTMSRMVLHEVLEERLRSLGVPVRLGTTVSAVRDTDDAVEVAFTDGSAGTYDLVVGADGVHSTTRPLLLPDAPEPAYAGQVIWRLDVHKPAELERYTMMLGRETRLGLSERRFERCRLVVDGSLQLSRWEREPDTPGADPGRLIGETFKALAAPI